MMSIYFLKLVVLLILFIIKVKTKCAETKYDSLKKSIIFSEFINMSLETYLDAIVAATLNWQATNKVFYSSETGNVISLYLTYYLFTVGLFVLPVMMLYILCQALEVL